MADNSNKLLGYLMGGLLIGPILAVGCPFVGVVIGGSASTASNDYSDTPIAIGLVAGLLAPLLIPVPFLFKPGSRPWGVGMLIGAALTMIVLGGICAGFIYLLSQESA
jgi:drug/metabolite transporter (DMT)-like permease